MLVESIGHNFVALCVQIFCERTDLVCHWFDLWTDLQRKAFLNKLLTKCARSQLHFVRDWFEERVPIRRTDFTCLLPRFINLHIFSFLDPRSLCRAARVRKLFLANANHFESFLLASCRSVPVGKLWQSMTNCGKLKLCAMVGFYPSHQIPVKTVLGKGISLLVRSVLTW